MIKKRFWKSCVGFGDPRLLDRLIDNAREVTMRTFLSNCEVDSVTRRDMSLYPGDYDFFSYRQGTVYFFRHSMIEYFYR